MNNNEVEIYEFEMLSKNFFVCTLNLINDDVVFALRPGLKTGMDLEFWSENGSVK